MNNFYFLIPQTQHRNKTIMFTQLFEKNIIELSFTDEVHISSIKKGNILPFRSFELNAYNKGKHVNR